MRLDMLIRGMHGPGPGSRRGAMRPPCSSDGLLVPCHRRSWKTSQNTKHLSASDAVVSQDDGRVLRGRAASATSKCQWTDRDESLLSH
jgi:hypothetical protein